MAFDPFGDADTQGYLRNIHGLPAGRELKELEHQDFCAFLPDALIELADHSNPGYQELLKVHYDLFCGLYPWAGKDRFELFPGSVVSKGSTQFAFSNHIEGAFNMGLKETNTPGQTLGFWTFAHPFLEGNGRALFTFFDDFLRRRGMALDWAAIERRPFLEAIDRQIAQLDGNHLDDVLKPHLSKPPSHGKRNTSSLIRVAWRSDTP